MAININKHFGEEVRKQRKLLKISQLELSVLAKIDLSTINRLERGLENITLKKAHNISKALHKPLYKMFLADKVSQKMERKGEIEGNPID